MENSRKDIDAGRGEAYQKYLVPAIFELWAKDLLAVAEPMPGYSVLDIACGTGVVTRLVAERVGPSGKVTGLDIDPGYLKIARSLSPPSGSSIEFHEGSATEVPFEDNSFDLALCQQGLQFIPDRLSALKEMRRVLRPGCKMVLSVWREGEFCPGFQALAVALERHGGLMENKPLTFSLGDAGELRSLAEGAGFRKVHIQADTKIARFPSAERFAEIVAEAGPAIGRAMSRLDDKTRAVMLEDVGSALVEYVDDEGLAIPNESHILVGYA